MAEQTDSMQALIASWMTDQGVKRRGDYVERGRRYHDLPDDLLVRSWGISCHCREAMPEDCYLRGEWEDLTSEMEIRNIALPRRTEFDAFQTLPDCTAPLAKATALDD